MYGLAMIERPASARLVGVVGDARTAAPGRRKPTQDDDVALQHRALTRRPDRPVAGLHHERHQGDQHRPGGEDVGVEHRHAEGDAPRR